ncbi:hypothetical protein TNCV_4489481 [Trichonephila clavipes]|nr:hypothetical protein TNCV_4489481 [Trichonephila clavipes]
MVFKLCSTEPWDSPRREELREQREETRCPRDFCDLPIRRDEGRVVNTLLVFKRVLFQERREEKRKETEKRRKRVERERERGAGLGWRKGLSPRLEWKDDERQGR